MLERGRGFSVAALIARLKSPVGRGHQQQLQEQELERRLRERLEDLRHSESQVQQLQKMDAVGRLAGGIAHDFNNMLGAISMYCDLVTEEPGNKDLVRDSIESIRKVSERGAALTRQLLVFSRKQIVQPRIVNLSKLVTDLEGALARLVGDNIEIVSRLSPELDPVRLDPSQLEQVIVALVVNARDAMPRGGRLILETANIKLDEEFARKNLSVEPGRYVLITVTDNGNGMDSDTLSRAFEPFFTTKTMDKGTGLGLTAAYGIVKQCKGMIWAASEPGKGSEFRIYLPVHEGAEDAPKAARPKPVQEPAGQTILLVEDDDSLRRGAVEMLGRRGFQVLAASGAEEALELCQRYEGTIDLLLTDVVMPKVGGFELAKQATQLRKGMRVLYMSGYTDETLGKAGSVDDPEIVFIQKPFVVSALIAKISEILG